MKKFLNQFVKRGKRCTGVALQTLTFFLPLLSIAGLHAYHDRLFPRRLNAVSVTFETRSLSDEQLAQLEKTKRRIESGELSAPQAQHQLMSYGVFKHISLQVLTDSDLHWRLVSKKPFFRLSLEEIENRKEAKDYWIGTDGGIFSSSRNAFRDTKDYPPVRSLIEKKDEEFFNAYGLFTVEHGQQLEKHEKKRFERLKKSASDLIIIAEQLEKRDFALINVDVSAYRGFLILARQRKSSQTQPIELRFGYADPKQYLHKLDHLLSLVSEPGSSIARAELDYEGKIFIKKRKDQAL